MKSCHFWFKTIVSFRFGMSKFWTPLSWNWDKFGLEYLSSIEAIQYPFVGVQFHPEKNIFEWSEREPRIPHSRLVLEEIDDSIQNVCFSHAVHVSLYFATHFVNMARKSSHTFSNR